MAWLILYPQVASLHPHVALIKTPGSLSTPGAPAAVRARRGAPEVFPPRASCAGAHTSMMSANVDVRPGCVLWGKFIDPCDHQSPSL